jgi:hypothetical protein
MKRALVLCGVIALAGGVAQATTYTDGVGTSDVDNFYLSQGFNHLDITSVDMTNDATNLYVTVNLNSNIAATNWGKYCMMFDTQAGGMSTPSNPWGRTVNTSVGVDFWLGSWVDSGGGAQLWKNNSVVWESAEFVSTSGSGLTQNLALAPIGQVSYTIALSHLGLAGFTPGVTTISFDVLSSGGGNDPGVDHLSNNNVVSSTAWGVASTTGTFLQYTLVPTPGTLALGAFGMLAVGRRRR